MSELERLLLSEATHDSSGTFTVDWKPALAKIGALSRLHPDRWILYLVQAAVAARALQVNITYSTGLIQVEVVFGAIVLDLDGVLAAKSRPAAFAHSALLWAQARGPKCVELLCQNSESGTLCRISGEKETRHPLPPGRARLALIYRPETSESPLSLSEALRYCPIPVFLNTRPVAQGEPLEESQAHLIYRRLVLAAPDADAVLAAAPPATWPAAHILAHSEIAMPKRFDSFGRLEIVGQLNQPPLQTSTPAQENQLPLLPDWVLPLDYCPFVGNLIRCHAVFYRLRKPLGKLQFVHYGLAFEAEDLPELREDGWGIVIASRSLRTDFTGLKVVQDEAYQRLRDWALETVAHRYSCLRNPVRM